MTRKVLTVVGARPQFIKAAAVSRIFRQSGADMGVEEIILHTGQHFDDNMSQVFFDQLDIPRPAYNLGLGGGGHGEMTGRMLADIEKVLLAERPDLVLVYGDTNSTLAGALAAVKLHIPVAHVEAGLRSFNMRMPEEINRVLTDRVASYLFCPTATAVRNLQSEGLRDGVHQVGDVMYDASLFYRDKARQESRILERLGFDENAYVLVTCHRAENTDDPARLEGILHALAGIAEELPVLFPMHPRTRAVLEQAGTRLAWDRLRVIEPLSYLDMVRLEQSAKAILTDSGGVQKEAFFYGIPCITLRDETEWVETVETGWNTLCGADPERILAAWRHLSKPEAMAGSIPYGQGDAAVRIVRILAEALASPMRKGHQPITHRNPS